MKKVRKRWKKVRKRWVKNANWLWSGCKTSCVNFHTSFLPPFSLSLFWFFFLSLFSLFWIIFAKRRKRITSNSCLIARTRIQLNDCGLTTNKLCVITISNFCYNYCKLFPCFTIRSSFPFTSNPIQFDSLPIRFISWFKKRMRGWEKCSSSALFSSSHLFHSSFAN